MALTATDLFNDASTRLTLDPTTHRVVGVGPDQVNSIVSDLQGVQQQLSAADPAINNLSDLHTHVIINQLNEEIASVQNANSPTGTPILGTDLGQFVGRSIDDIHRDIIDIAQADTGVQALFNPTPLTAPNPPSTPFQDNADQTAFLTKFIQDSNHLGQEAVKIADKGFHGDIGNLTHQIQTFENNANSFDQSQGGLYSARFWNELRSDGTAGTASNALIEGLQNHNAGEVKVAAQQLSMNASDVAGNNLMADGNTYDAVVAAAQAGKGNNGNGQANNGNGQGQNQGNGNGQGNDNAQGNGNGHQMGHGHQNATPVADAGGNGGDAGQAGTGGGHGHQHAAGATAAQGAGGAADTVGAVAHDGGAAAGVDTQSAFNAHHVDHHMWG
jgi:trimeric autotransporter adhesin